MAFFLSWLVFTGVQLAATLSPGPAFAILVRSTLRHGRVYGLYTALGLALGVMVYVLGTIGGLLMLLTHAKGALELLRYAGAAYLIYIGIQALTSPPNTENMPSVLQKSPDSSRNMKGLRTGFFSQMLNPKAFIFFTAIFTQFVSAQTPSGVLILYCLTTFFIELAWWCFLAFVLSHRVVKEKFGALSHKIERICGGLMIGLGVGLILSKIHE